MTHPDRSPLAPGPWPDPISAAPTRPRVVAPASARLRARTSNTVGLLPGVDQRSAQARRFRDVAGAVVADLGGPEALSELQFQLVRRVASLAVLLEAIDAQVARGETIDVAAYAVLIGALNRIATRLGIARHKPPEQSLADYLKEVRARPAPTVEPDNEPGAAS